MTNETALTNETTLEELVSRAMDQLKLDGRHTLLLDMETEAGVRVELHVTLARVDGVPCGRGRKHAPKRSLH